MAKVDIDDIIEYQVFRRNPGPLLARAAEGKPLLLLKGRTRFVVMDAASYTDLVQRASGVSGVSGLLAATEGASETSQGSGRLDLSDGDRSEE